MPQDQTVPEKAPILEFDDERPAVIEPSEVVRHHDAPERIVITFFQEAVATLADELRLRPQAPIQSEMGELPFYAGEHRSVPIGVLPCAVGAPLAAGCLEEVIARGGRRFIVCGGAGVLDSSIGSGDIVVSTAALRDEGTSYHYLPASRLVEPTAAALTAITTALQEHGVPFVTGTTWTTDGFYRETRGKVARRRAEGCITVEMEAAALFAVARFRGVELAQMLYGGDDVGGEAWDPREFGQRVPARERVLRLALEACLRV